MRLRYEQLFTIDLLTPYYVDDLSHEDFSITPTTWCQEQMRRYKIISKKAFNGILLIYECSPATNDATPFRPIPVVEKFTFTVRVQNADFWYYADVQNWQQDKVVLFRNTIFNTPGNISVHNGPLLTPVLFRPMQFKHELPLENVSGLLQVLDSNNNVIKNIIVRAKTAAEPANAKEAYLVDLNQYPDGQYTLRHLTTGGPVNEPVYCSEDYATDVFAVVEINYQSGNAWTGVDPFQHYQINITSRMTDWFYDVHIRERDIPPFLASQLSILHIPAPAEPLQSFSVVGVPDDLNGFVQFKSNAQIRYSQQPIHLQLRSPSATILDPMPLPSAVTFQKDALNNLITRMIVNV